MLCSGGFDVRSTDGIPAPLETWVHIAGRPKGDLIITKLTDLIGSTILGSVLA
jgi:hypothetical protein